MSDLKAAVWLQDDTGQLICFKPGDDVPRWAAAQMGDHCFDGPRPDDDGDDYKAWAKAELEAEVVKRNATRDPDDQIQVGGKGNKPDLVAALVADDEAGDSGDDD